MHVGAIGTRYEDTKILDMEVRYTPYSIPHTRKAGLADKQACGEARISGLEPHERPKLLFFKEPESIPQLGEIVNRDVVDTNKCYRNLPGRY